MTFTTPKTWVTGEPLTASDLNTYVRDNQDALKAPPADINNIDKGSNITTTSTSFVDVDATDFSATITTTGGRVKIEVVMTIKQSANQLYFRTTTDGNADQADDGLACYIPASSAQAVPVTLTFWKEGLSAGSHTFKLQWKVSSGTGTIYAGAGSSPDIHPQFSAVEVS